MVQLFYNYVVAVDGGWGAWSEFTACSASCGNGSVQRTRNCDKPAPQNNGSDCQGAGSETSVCTEKACQGMFTASFCYKFLVFKARPPSKWISGRVSYWWEVMGSMPDGIHSGGAIYFSNSWTLEMEKVLTISP